MQLIIPKRNFCTQRWVAKWKIISFQANALNNISEESELTTRTTELWPESERGSVGSGERPEDLRSAEEGGSL